MTRAFFAVAAGLMCGMYGLRLSAALRAEARQLQHWVEILSRVALYISEGTLAMPDVLRHAADASTQPDMLLHEVADALAADPMTPLADAFASRCPAGIGHDVLLRLFMRLGHGSADSRRLAAEQARESIALLAAQAAARADRDAKLYRTLGWTGGACLTILLL